MDSINQRITKLINKLPSSEYDCGDGNKMSIFNGIGSAEFNTVVSGFINDGFSEQQSNIIDKLSSITLFDEKEGCYAVFVFDGSISELRVIKDSFSQRLNVKAGASGETKIRLWQFEIDHSLIDCGMCYIVQSSDYSFFIVDSAHTYSVNDDLRIYDFLRSKTPESLPVVVSAWFFSHGHVDHIGKFLDILKYNKDIIIKGIYYNFVPNDHFSSDCWMPSDKNHTEDFNRVVRELDDIPLYKLHTGQFFYVDRIRFDVLCTHEDVYPVDLENYNDSSTVIMMTVDGDKVCFPGDAGGAESDILVRRFPEFLNCDIMQVAHHGHFGTSSEFYRLAASTVVLFATTQIKFDEELPHYEANRVACDIAEHCFIASNGTVEFEFPLKDSVITVYPDEIIENFEGVYRLWGYDYSDEFKNNLINKHLNSKDFTHIPFRKKD